MGYQIRFEKTVKKDTKILFLTEGLLLRQVIIFKFTFLAKILILLREMIVQNIKIKVIVFINN